MNITIRQATTTDAKRLLEIYSYYVKNTAVSFELDVPSLQEFTTRIETITQKYPYFVAEKDGTVIGYAYANQFKTRAAYSHCVELSIYIEETSHKQGIGKLLYNELENHLQRMGIKNLYAGVAFPCKKDGIIQCDKYLTTSSYDFHKHLGFTEVAHLNKCGIKFGNTYDLVYMEKLL